jgi:hypothetical protein
MKKILPSNFDLVDYDKELLKKQLDLETVVINITQNEDLAKKYEIYPYYHRTWERAPNEEGMFKRLMQDLEVIS